MRTVTQMLRGAVGVTLALSALVVAAATPSGASSVSLSWSSPTLPTVSGWLATAYGNGRWVVTGNQNVFLSSTNGTSWSEATVPSGEWSAVTYGDGKWVALDTAPPLGSTAAEVTSTNGSTWTTVNGTADGWSAVQYEFGRFIAVSFDGTAWWSSNGTTWHQATAPSGQDWWSMAYGDGRLVAVSHSTGDIMTTTNGTLWTLASVPYSLSLGWGGVAYGNGIFVASDDHESSFNAVSLDGVHWTLSPMNQPGQFSTVGAGCGLFVLPGYQAQSSQFVILTTTVGTSWLGTAPNPNVNEGSWAIAFGGQRFVAVSTTGGLITANGGSKCVQSLPNPPTAFHGTVASHEIIADWSAPTVVGSAPIASYTVTAAVLGHKYTCTTTKTTCTVAGLTNGLSYAVTVTARSIEGISAASATSMVVPTSSTKLATAPPFVAAVGEPFVVPVTGVAPGSAVTVTATYATGSATCVAGSFGQCEATMTLTNTSKTTVSASQTVAHVKVHAPTTTARVATLSAIPPSMNYDHQLTVSINDGVPNEVFEVTTAEGFTTTPKTDSNGNANAYVSFPLAQQYCLVTVYQDGDLLEQGMTQIL